MPWPVLFLMNEVIHMEVNRGRRSAEGECMREKMHNELKLGASRLRGLGPKDS